MATANVRLKPLYANFLSRSFFLIMLVIITTETHLGGSELLKRRHEIKAASIEAALSKFSLLSGLLPGETIETIQEV